MGVFFVMNQLDVPVCIDNDSSFVRNSMKVSLIVQEWMDTVVLVFI